MVSKFVGENLTARIETLVLNAGTVTELEKQESVLRGRFVASHEWTTTDLKAVLREKVKFLSKT